MGPLLSLAGALLVATSPCYLPSDQTAGWKRVELPEDAPALAAPWDIDQFRSGEHALLHEVNPRDTYLGAIERHAGRMAYSFRVPKGAFRLGMVFVESLDGAKVDATAYAGARAFPLLSERRQSGNELWLQWAMPDVDTVVVEVHHHLREKPVVRSWEVNRDVTPSRESSLPAGFQVARSLYFRHPGGGRRIELCENPGPPPVLENWPEGAPVAVTLTRSRGAAP